MLDGQLQFLTKQRVNCLRSIVSIWTRTTATRANWMTGQSPSIANMYTEKEKFTSVTCKDMFRAQIHPAE
jgi:hypothetical protein